MRPQMWLKSKVLSIGITTLLILGLFLGSCTPKEAAPAPPPTEPSPGKPTAPAPSPEEPAPIVTPAPLRPETPFVTKEEGILFQDDFEDSMAEGWVLEHGWQVKSEGTNCFLSGFGHSLAYTTQRGWTDYTIEARIRIITGTFHFCFRNAIRALEMGSTRYFLAIDERGFGLRKSIESDYFDLGEPVPDFGLNAWRSVKITVEGSNIKVYLDGVLRINYVDSSAPILAGEFGLESLQDCQVQVDDITVTGVKLKQRTKWVKTGGPPGGVGYDVRISPVDKNIMFVTDNPSGVNKSYDGGQTWVQRNRGITTRVGGSLDGIPIFCLTIDPNDPDIVWTGTQGARGVSKSRGIYKSTDGGETWVKKDNGVQEMDEITFRSFAIHPQNSSIVLTGTEITTGFRGIMFDKTKGKIYKTEDGGDNWRCVWEGNSLVRVILFDYTNPNMVYASTGIFDREPFKGAGEGILKSTDGGETWHQINNGLTTLNLGFLEMHPRNPEILFAAGGANALTLQGGDRGVYRTKDGGQHWEKVLTDDNTLSFNVVVFSPSHPDVVYAGSEAAFYRSDNGGDTWHRFNKPEENCYGPPGIRAGSPIGAVVDSDDPMTIFVNNYDGGVFKSTDGGKTWVGWSEGYTGAEVFDIAVVPDNPAAVYTIGKNGAFRSFNSGEDWTGLNFVPIDHTLWLTIALNPTNPQEVLISDQDSGVIHKSADGGNRWRNVYRNPIFDYQDPATFHGFSTIAYAPSNPSIVYAGMRKSGAGLAAAAVGEGSSFGIFKSTDSGETWVEKNRGLEHSMRNINDIAVDPTNVNIVYAATHNDGTFKTVDGGESWVAINNGLMALQVYSLAIDPNNPDTIYAGLGQGVGLFKSIDGGQHWEGINYGIRVECPSYLQRVGQVKPGVSLEKPKRLLKSGYYSVPWTNIRSIVIDPVETQTLYAGDLQGGVYISTDGGESWTAINDGLSTKAVAALALSADGRMLYAATVGEGVFRLELW